MSSTVCQACFLAKAKEEIIEFYDDLSICKSCMNKLGATETEQTTSPSSVTVKLEESEQTSGEAVNPSEKLEEPEQTLGEAVNPWEKLEEPEQTSGEAVNPWEKLEEPEQTSGEVLKSECTPT